MNRHVGYDSPLWRIKSYKHTKYEISDILQSMTKSIHSIIAISFTCLIITRCTDSNTIKYYGFDENGLDERTIVISKPLRQFKSFKELCDSINNIQCNDKKAALNVNSKNTIQTLKLIGQGRTKMISRHLRPRNILSIVDDSIISIVNHPIDSLENSLMKHYSNYGNSPYYAQTPERLLIRIRFIENELDELPHLLNRIILKHEELNSSNTLRIELYDIISPPKPPGMQKPK